MISLTEEFDTFKVSFGEITVTGDVETYEGSYNVTPKTTAQELATENKACRQNIKIASIPFYSVDNLQGGKTITIGG